MVSLAKRVLTIGDLAKSTDMNEQTIRYYRASVRDAARRTDAQCWTEDRLLDFRMPHRLQRPAVGPTRISRTA